MSKPKIKQYIICYDIKNHKRLYKASKELEEEAIRIQLSAFLLLATEKQHRKLIGKLSKVINHKEDDLRSYRIDDFKKAFLLGNQKIPELYYF